MKVSRGQVLAYRVAQQGLQRDSDDLDLFDLGVQDTSNGTARLALAARLPEPPVELDGLTLIWSYRGAPHLHRTTDIPALARALWPSSEADALSKLAWQRSMVAKIGMPAIKALAVAAQALRDVVPASMSKDAVSTAVTCAVPPELSCWCRGCEATHILEQLMRLAALPSGIKLEIGRYPATLSPINRWTGVPQQQSGVVSLINNYLRFLGPATSTEVASFLGTTRKELLSHWPAKLSEVDVEGRVAWLPTEWIDLLENPPAPPEVRLLPAYDPLLQARDRGLLVPDKKAQKQLWRILGNPGALLVDGDIAGTWRSKSSKSRVQITVQPFAPLDPSTIELINAEARTVAAVRGAADVRVEVV